MRIIPFLQDNRNQITHFLELLLVALLFFGVGVLYAEYFIYQKPGIVIINKALDETLQIKATEGKYMASKSGKNYYLITCMSRIKDENKIYFKTKQDAEKAGYTPSKQCFKD